MSEQEVTAEAVLPEKTESFQDGPTHPPPHALQNGLADCSDLGAALHLWKPACQDEAKLQREVDQGSAAQW